MQGGGRTPEVTGANDQLGMGLRNRYSESQPRALTLHLPAPPLPWVQNYPFQRRGSLFTLLGKGLAGLPPRPGGSEMVQEAWGFLQGP